jgi:hypothetical protein
MMGVTSLAHRCEPLSERHPASEVKNGACPGKPEHLTKRDKERDGYHERQTMGRVVTFIGKIRS